MPGRLIDLHTHSLASDGSDRPAELIRNAAAAGLSAVALTDHDTLAGIPEAAEEAQKIGIRFIPGIEIAVQDDFGELHLVGLWMPPEPSRRMCGALDILRANRRSRNQAMLDVLEKLGMPLSLDEVRSISGGGAVGRPHIALAMCRKGYAGSRKEVFEHYIGWGKKAFVPRVLSTPEEGIGLLRDEGATVCLAHPCLFSGMTRERLDDTLSQFRAYGLSALEAYHSAHDPGRVRLCVELAAKHNLLLSGGSDYHGANKEGIALGKGQGRLRIPLHLLEKMEEHRRKQGLWL